MLKNQDIVVLLALIGRERTEWDFVTLGDSLELSASAVHRAVGRLRDAGLYSAERGAVRAEAAAEFVVHAAKFIAPLEQSAVARGVPTGATAAPLADALTEPAERAVEAAWVWPHPEGTRRGTAVAPLLSAVPGIALRDPVMHRRLAALDALRGGRARERQLAASWFRQELGLA